MLTRIVIWLVALLKKSKKLMTIFIVTKNAWSTSNVPILFEVIWRTRSSWVEIKNNYQSNNRKYKWSKTCMPKHLFDHFNEGWHNSYMKDVCIIFLDEADPSELWKLEIIKKTLLKQLTLWESILKIVSNKCLL